jgi:hypothetical protein
MENPIDDKIHMLPMTDAIIKLKEKGFNKEFSITPLGELTYPEGRIYSPDHIKIIDFFRFEGESDPSDESILYALETNDNVKGILSHIYGREASEESQKASEFFTKIRLSKQQHPLAS